MMTRDGKTRFGPYSLEQLERFAIEGRVQPNDLLWHEGLSEWVHASSVVGHSISPPPPISPPLPPHSGGETASDCNRIVLGIVAILLGSLGIHKFMLGQTNAGIAMLLITVLTCGYGGIIMGLIGLVEGIIYLTKSDEEFHYIYCVEKKAWF